ncbi:MAG TPA: hypothetical protein VK190_04885 [Pseudoneobacillus sp.]|nr:hypothetical protein [Pseudoneobacillus sp.]
MVLSGKFQVIGKKKKTSAEFFKTLQIGDIFELVYNLNGRYEGAPTVKIYQNGHHIHTNNALQLKTNLDKFDIKQIKE